MGDVGRMNRFVPEEPGPVHGDARWLPCTCTTAAMPPAPGVLAATSFLCSCCTGPKALGSAESSSPLSSRPP